MKSDVLLEELFYVMGSNLISIAFRTLLHVSRKIEIKTGILVTIITKCVCTVHTTQHNEMAATGQVELQTKLNSQGGSHIISWFLIKPLQLIDNFHKWRPIINSFASIKISLTDLILKLIIQKKFYSETRLVRLI